jgi:hypothetical protein
MVAFWSPPQNVPVYDFSFVGLCPSDLPYISHHNGAAWQKGKRERMGFEEEHEESGDYILGADDNPDCIFRLGRIERRLLEIFVGYLYTLVYNLTRIF